MRRALGVTIAAACALVWACGSSASVDNEPLGIGGGGGDAGAATPPGPGDPTPGADGAAPPSGDAGGCAPAPCALPAAPPGFELVSYGDASEACPSGFDEADLLEDLTPAAGACACGACAMTGTTCSTGTLTTALDNGNGLCGTTGASITANTGNCRNQNGTFGEYARVNAPAAVPGTCTRPSTPVKANVTSVTKRVCTKQAATCAGAACAAGAGRSACIAADGDVDCPAGAPNKHLIGADFDMTCAPCGCTITATCGGTATFYQDNDCNNSPRALTAGTCTFTNQASFSSYKWVGIVATETCNMAPAPAPTLTLQKPRTVCCP